MKDIKALFERYSLPTYTRSGPVFVKGKGSYLWDEKGEKYLDLFPGWGVSILGHCHPRIVKVIKAQAQHLLHLPNNFFIREQALLAEKINQHSFPAKVFFANSGAEVVEGALKFSRLFGKDTSRYEIISMQNSFHGRTFGAMSATGQAKYKDPFNPVLPGFKTVKFNDIESFKKALTKKTSAVILELVQGEGGVNVAGVDYVKELRAICDQKKLLLIIDEVQTGMGRTGKLFAYQKYGITPDLMTLSKGLGAGVPISALVVNIKIADLIKPGMHASTFGGSPLACRASFEAFSVIEEEKILDNVKTMGNYLKTQFNRLSKKFSFIKEVRGQGLMFGLELDCPGAIFVTAALEKKLIINATHNTVLRILPALNVSKNDLDKGLAILEDVFKKG